MGLGYRSGDFRSHWSRLADAPLWPVIQTYLSQGFRRFLLLTDYQAESIERFSRERLWREDATVESQGGSKHIPDFGLARG